MELLVPLVPFEDAPEDTEVEAAADGLAEVDLEVGVLVVVVALVDAADFWAVAWLTPAIRVPVRAIPVAATAAPAIPARRRRFRSRDVSFMTPTMGALGSGPRHRSVKPLLRRRVGCQCVT